MLFSTITNLMNAEVAIFAVALIASIGITLNAAEILTSRGALDDFFAWKVVRLRHTWLHGDRNVLSFLIRRVPFRILTVVQVAAAIVTPFWLFYNVSYPWLPPLGVLGVHLLSSFRFPYSMSGADQMQSIVWVGVLGYGATGTHLGKVAALVFIAIQSVFSYLVSGCAKLTAEIPYWRDGTAVRRVLETETFGIPGLSERYSLGALSKFASWSTLAFEIFGPALVLFGSKTTLAFVGMAVAFHAGIAALMGLNRFFFAFCAALPAVYWVSTQIHGWIGLV